MTLPIPCVQVGVADGIAAVDHPIVSHIDAYMGDARCVIGALEKYQIAGADAASGDRGADVIKALGAGSLLSGPERRLHRSDTAGHDGGHAQPDHQK